MDALNNFINTYYITVATISAFASFVGVYLYDTDGQDYFGSQMTGLFLCCIWPFSLILILVVLISIGVLLLCKFLIAALTDALDYISDTFDYTRREIKIRKAKNKLK